MGKRLLNGNTKSCGCLQKEVHIKSGKNSYKDLLNQRFGKLVVIEKTDIRKYNSVVWKCQCDCGNIILTTSDCLVNNHTTSCGCRTMSKGEEKIIKILKENNIFFVREKTFEDLKNGKFRYDFYLPELNIIVEYDGPQHFQQVEYFQKTRQDFLKAQERDRRKNNYALAHGIPLYRIPYWEIDELCGLPQIFDEKHLVKSMYHNDRLSKPKKL